MKKNGFNGLGLGRKRRNDEDERRKIKGYSPASLVLMFDSWTLHPHPDFLHHSTFPAVIDKQDVHCLLH